MKYLFVHQNFPGQFLHFVRHLVRQQRHEVVFITEPNANLIPGVRKVPHRKPAPPTDATHPSLRELELAFRRADAVAEAARNLKILGFTPDIIIGHHGWGELLNLRDVWPGAPVLGYFEFFYNIEGADVGFDPEFPVNPFDFPRIRAKNAVNLLALQNAGHGQTPTEWQLSTYPEWARKQITVLREGVDLEVCRPKPEARRAGFAIGDWKVSPREKLVTYVSRDLEPYRGFHVMMRALPHLLAKRRDVKVVMVGGDGVSYGGPPPKGNWRQVLLNELGGKISPDRVLFPGRIPYPTYAEMLQRSDAHVYLTYPFVASWSLREAMASGCAIIGSDTPPVQEFISHEGTGLLTPFHKPRPLADAILRVLEDRALNQGLRAEARHWAEQNLDLQRYLTQYDELIGGIAGDAGAQPLNATEAQAPKRRAASAAAPKSSARVTQLTREVSPHVSRPRAKIAATGRRRS